MQTAKLNAAQQRAVEAGGGPVLIIAGPGTGKTKTLTARIVHLLTTGQAKPGEIIALTFTNKAAREMQERVSTSLEGSLPLITTFHAFGHKLIGTDTPLVDEPTRMAIMREIAKPASFKGINARELSLIISRAKTSLATPSEPDTKALLQHYNQTLAQQGWCDFDDLLIKAYEQLRARPDKHRFAYVLVDEFQDTSELQYELLRSLSMGENVFAIGDPNQSIYAFRGAGAQMFDRFRQDFPQAQQIELTVNYRSAPEVVTLANAVFPKAPQLTAHQTQAGCVQAVRTLNERGEAAYILDVIERGIGGSDLLKASSEAAPRQLRDYAVQYRTHRAATVIKRRFAESGIPYQVAGEDSPYATPAIQTLLGLMRYLHEPSEAALRQLADQSGLKELTGSQIRALLQDIVPPSASVSDLAAALAERFNLIPEKQQADFRQLLGVFVQFGRGPAGLAACLQYVDTLSEQEFFDPNVQAVALLTIHAAKGLEFEHVFLCAAEEDILPKIRAGQGDDVDEERRLFYVAATRARQQLEVLYTKKRAGEAVEPSRFITELPDTTLSRIDDPAMSTQQKQAEKRRQKRAQTSLF